MADEISYAYEKHSEIDETEWFINELWICNIVLFAEHLSKAEDLAIMIKRTRRRLEKQADIKRTVDAGFDDLKMIWMVKS